MCGVCVCAHAHLCDYACEWSVGWASSNYRHLFGMQPHSYEERSTVKGRERDG